MSTRYWSYATCRDCKKQKWMDESRSERCRKCQYIYVNTKEYKIRVKPTISQEERTKIQEKILDLRNYIKLCEEKGKINKS